jgi:4-hydroxythreonine-4-phosphate dehydrogenase
MADLERPTLAITMGDVQGIGPEILAKALARPEPAACAGFKIFGDPAAYERARQWAPTAPSPDALTFVTGPLAPPAFRPGTIDPAAGACAIEWVKAAVAAWHAGEVDAVVTCPIHKTAVYQAGYPHIGHTELVAELTGAAHYRMCLFAGGMRVLHHTGHLALRDALDAVTTDSVEESILIGHEALLAMGISRPRIAVMGLNPHAGEQGAFGREDGEVIAPAVARARARGVDCDGPHSPDAVLDKMRDGRYDLVVAMYHDQGHIAMKLLARDEGVNVTLGIPMVRTSVDHGTAFDIAWQGRASEESLRAAIALAADLARARGERPCA